MFQVLDLGHIFWCGYATFTFLLLIQQSVFILLNIPTKGTSPTPPTSAINSLGLDSKKTAVSLLLTPPEHPTASPLSGHTWPSVLAHSSVMTLQASSFSSQPYKTFCFFHWANLHFPVGNTALHVYHSLNKLWHPRKIKVHNRCSF